MNSEFVVVLTGAAGNIGSTLVFLLASQEVFGTPKGIVLRLIDLPEKRAHLEGLKMELEDSLFDRLERVEIREENVDSFRDADCVLLVAGKPRLLGMERRDLLDKNAQLFRKMAGLCNETVKPDTKYLVVANPCNTNALLLSELAPNIPKKNITALSMLDQSRAQFWIAQKLDVKVSQVKNVVVIGNHSLSMYVDTSFGTVHSPEGSRAKVQSVSQLIDASLLDKELQKFVQVRGGKIIQAKGSSSCFSAAQAIVKHLQYWYLGSKGEIVSMAVFMKSVLGFNEELFVSMPVVCENSDYQVLGDWVKDKSAEQLALIDRSIESLVEEKMCVYELVSINAEEAKTK